MKICIIGHTRSRSSHLRDVISGYYHIPIIGQKLDTLYEMLYKDSWISTGNPGKEPVFYLNLLKSHLAEVNYSHTGVVKIHPTQLSFIPTNGKLIDFDMFSFSQYQKVYFTARKDISELVSSLYVAHVLAKFTYKDQSEIITDIQPMKFECNIGYDRMLMLLYSDLVSLHLKEYLTSHGIEWEHIDYEDIPNYIEQRFNNLGSTNLETNYRYKDIITNYDELESIYESLKPIAHRRFYEANPQLDI